MNRAQLTSQRRQRSSRATFHPACERTKAGFTLIELLVVVAVLLILLVMTVTAIDFTFNSERLRSGTRQIQSAFEGARDRAIFARESRGLRLLVDPDDPRIVTTMIYVGGTKDWSEGRIRLERIIEDANNNGSLDPGEDQNANGVLDAPWVGLVRGDETCGWYTLKQRGFLGVFEDLNLNGVLDAGEDQNGNGLLDRDAPRIKIPADDNGSWYTVLTHRITAADQILQLVTPYRDPGTTPSNQVVAFQGTGPSTYILELPPRVLPDAQPILLPEGICVDLDASEVPDWWRPGPLSTHTIPYAGHMDILFSPRGVVTGSIAAMGLLHLYLCERKDVTRVVDIGVEAGGTAIPRPAVNNTVGPFPLFPAGPEVNFPLVPGINQFNAEELIGQRRVLTIFTQTGKVSTHEIDPADGEDRNGNGVLDPGEDTNSNGLLDGPNGYADDPFHFAKQGEATGQ